MLFIRANTAQQPYHNHIRTPFHPIPSSVRPHICLPACTSALVAIFRLPPVGAQVMCPPPSVPSAFCQFSFTHTHLCGHPPTHFVDSPRQPLWHPGIGPWGCYVHCWKGHAGLCLPLAHRLHATHP